jgi:Tol biopolymer transport system component
MIKILSIFLSIFLSTYLIQAQTKEYHELHIDYYDRIVNCLINSEDIEIFNLGRVVNRSGIDYGPIISFDGTKLYFVSDRRGGIKGEYGKPSHDYWVASKASPDDLFFTEVKNLDPSLENNLHLNTSYHEGVGSISADGKYLFYTCCDLDKTIGSCDITKIIINNTSKICKPVAVGDNISNEMWEAQPCLGPYGRSLYFVSNRPDGEQINNIFKSTWNEKEMKWSNPVMLDDINFEMECSPFITPDGKTLIFASQSHWPHYGSHDLFISTYKNDEWTEPINLGEKINSENSDIFPSLSTSGDFLYFTSNRNGEEGHIGSYDLYVVRIPKCNESKYMPVSKCYPKSFSKNVTFEYDLPEDSHVTIEIQNVYDEKIIQLTNEIQSEGIHKVIWDGTKQGRRLPAGMYYYIINFKNDEIDITEKNDILLVRK